MTRHLFKLVWNRKRSSGLILVELLISFLVLCVVLTASLRYADLWRRPLGFDYHDVWEIFVSGVPFYRAGDSDRMAAREGMRRLRQTIADLPEVEAAALMDDTPYSGASYINGIYLDGQLVRILRSHAEPAAREILELDLIYGRWLEDSDSALDWTPVVINRALARALFGREDPLGRLVPVFNRDGTPREPENRNEIRRIVGVLSDYRKDGELTPSPYVAISTVNFDSTAWLPPTILLRLQPGTPRAFEEQLVAALRGAAPQWTYEITDLADRRRESHTGKLLPLLVGGVVAGFLILMVGLGLVGVLWQSVIRRTQELGLRRAVGATGNGVRGQIVGELLALTTLAVALGSALFLQVPLLGLAAGIGYAVVVPAVLLAALLLCGFVAVCGLYPSWLATRIGPAEALQYE